MIKKTIDVETTLSTRSNLEINDFINNLKESFEKVVIISIENLPMEYSKFYNYNYKVRFYHKLNLKID
jgi:hypothetical protein